MMTLRKTILCDAHDYKCNPDILTVIDVAGLGLSDDDVRDRFIANF
jgi:hypothetical protein